MELTNFSRVAIIGGGPAGSLTAYFMLDIAKQLGIHLNLDIYEPALYSAPGPKGCNFCGGIVSETLVQMLAMEGINLPPDVVQRGIDSYFLHTEQGSASIQTPLDEMRIAALYRGAGPPDCIKRSAEISFQDKVVYKSFDGFLQQLAIQSGANVITKRVAEVIREEPFPVVVPKGGEPRRYDLVVGAVGVNGGGIKLFEKTMPNFKAPQTTTAFLTEIFMDREKVDKYFGNAMHVFLVKIPHVNFAAIVPKAEYVSVILLGKGVNKESAKAFLSHPDVKKCFPDDIDLSPKSCQCHPKVNIGLASPVFQDRIVMVGDAGVSRLFKDGLGAAYITSKACATTAMIHGVSKQDFKQFYLPACKKLDVDNKLGKMVFLTVDLFKWIPILSKGMLRMVQREQQPNVSDKDMSMVLWDTFTGSNTYRSIVKRCLNPFFLTRLFWESFKSLLSRKSEAKIIDYTATEEKS